MLEVEDFEVHKPRNNDDGKKMIDFSLLMVKAIFLLDLGVILSLTYV